MKKTVLASSIADSQAFTEYQKYSEHINALSASAYQRHASDPYQQQSSLRRSKPNMRNDERSYISYSEY